MGKLKISTIIDIERKLTMKNGNGKVEGGENIGGRRGNESMRVEQNHRGSTLCSCGEQNRTGLPCIHVLSAASRAIQVPNLAYHETDVNVKEQDSNK